MLGFSSAQLVANFVFYQSLSDHLGDPTQVAWFGYLMMVGMVFCFVVSNVLGTGGGGSG